MSEVLSRRNRGGDRLGETILRMIPIIKRITPYRALGICYPETVGTTLKGLYFPNRQLEAIFIKTGQASEL